MNNTIFYIDINIQTPEGPTQYGRFELGQDRESANELFKKLKGSPAVDPRDMLFIELVEIVNGLPVNIDVLTCDLQQLGTNAMLITQEVFKIYCLRAGK
ncbi:MAG: hypothetical protein ABI688_04855 [Bacteroidota bacterium]